MGIYTQVQLSDNYNFNGRCSGGLLFVKLRTKFTS